MVERPLSMREVPGSIPGFSISSFFNMQRVIRTPQQAQTGRQEAQFFDRTRQNSTFYIYPTYRVVCQFIFDKILATTNITKTPDKFSLPEFPFPRRNKASMFRTSNHPLFNCNENSLGHFGSRIYVFLYNY